MATELGKAYVQVIPSAKGVKQSLNNIFDDGAGSASKRFGTGFASGFKTIIASAGISAALSSVISEGAKLEQSFGGIKTIYGDAADGVKQFAKEAAQAGISANNYAEQAVSFGASLRQALGGDMVKAGEAANKAIFDMADNSAKMGTSLESIQFAYQGFAKQNYTMLDNLKLGYGGTKAEMERLLKDAQKLSGVKYDIGNLADVYDAIHVIQEDLGITGVAADEAKTTITGSMNAVKSAFENVAASLTLGEDIKPALQQLAISLKYFLVDNLMPALVNVLKALPYALITFVKEIIPEVADTGKSLLETFRLNIIENLPCLLETGLNILNEICTGIFNSLPNLLLTANFMLNSFITYLMDNLPLFLESGINFVLNIIKGLISSLPTLLSTAFRIISDTIANIASRLPEFLQKGIELISELAAGFIQAIPDLLAKVPVIFKDVVDEFKKYDWLSIGSDIIAGIAEGIYNGIATIIDAVISVADSAINAAKDFLGIHSPSREFMWIGEMTGEGLALGISKSAHLVENSMKDITDNLINANHNDNSLKFAVSGEYDVDDVRRQGSSFNQTVNVYSPRELSASEVARQTRNATRQMALSLNLGGSY